MAGMLSGALGGMAAGINEVAKMSLEDMAAKRRDEAKARREAAGLKARKDIADKDRASREKIAGDKAKSQKDKDQYYTTTEKDELGGSKQSRHKLNPDGTSARVVEQSELDAFDDKDKNTMRSFYDTIRSQDEKAGRKFDEDRAYRIFSEKAPKLAERADKRIFRDVNKQEVR